MRTTLRNFASLLAPNPFTFGWIACSCVAELALLATAERTVYHTDLALGLFGLLFLITFWVSTGWAVHWIARYCDQAETSTSGAVRVATWLTATCCLTLLALAYLVSWTLFLRSGRFANLEAGRFLVFNFTQLWTYLAEAEPRQLAIIATVILAMFATIPYVLVRSARGTWMGAVPNPMARGCAWIGLCLLTLAVWIAIPRETSHLRRADRVHSLKHSLHPTFTLYMSHLESRLNGKIEACLDVSQLVPLSSHDQTTSNDDTQQTRPSVIFVAIESLRHDTIHLIHQGVEVLPNINQLARDGLHLTRSYSQSTHSDYADPCLVSSLYPLRTHNHHYYGPSDPWPRTLIYDVLKPRGYATAIISSQNEAWGGMAHFLNRPSLDHFYHPETRPEKTVVPAQDQGFAHEVASGALVAGKFPDAHTTDEAIRWITEQTKAGQPFFLSMNFQSSHFPYLMPDAVPRPFQPCKLDPQISFLNYPLEATESVRNAYMNAIHECDRQVGRLVHALRELGQLDNTILVVTGENGEAFHESGCVTHACAPVQPVIRVACVLHAPNRIAPGVEDYPFEHVDLVPTVLGLMGVEAHPNFQGTDILSPARIPADDKLTFCHVMSGLFASDTVMLGGRWKLTHDLRQQQYTLHDVETDPYQEVDLAAERTELVDELKELLSQWRRQQLAYYHHPSYYLSYYPPRPPRRDSPHFSRHALASGF